MLSEGVVVAFSDSSAANCGWSEPIHTVTRCVRTSKRCQGVPGDIVLAARLLFERDGVKKTTLTAVAKEAGITRTLLYYYSEDKDAVVQAVVEDYVEDIVESVATWNEQRVFGNTPDELRKCVATFRHVLYMSSGEPRPMFSVLDELGMRDEFAARAVREAVDCICRNIVSEYTAYRTVEIDLVPETFALVLYGVVGLMKAKPDITDDEISRLIAQTLRVDMRVLQPPPWSELPRGDGV